MSVLFLQMGDFAEAHARMVAGGAETYRDQYRSLRHVEAMAADRPVVVAAPAAQTIRVEIGPRLQAVGLPGLDPRAVAALIGELRPRHVILRVPRPPLLSLALRSGAWVLPGYADLFARGGPRGWWRNRRHARLLAHPRVSCVANHNLNASRSLRDVLGVDPGRIVPWDWSRVPLSPPRSAQRAPGDPFRLFYAGMLSEPKGVGDLIAAAGRLVGQGIDVHLRLAGKGEPPEVWQARAAAAGLALDRLALLGMIANTEVRAEMAVADAVVVPSRPSYDEGLPNTIYEALAARAPLVLSDHPAFAGRVQAGRDALVARAADPAALAEALARIARDPALAARLSEAAPAAHEGLYAGMDWCDLVDRFLDDPKDRTGWVATHALTGFEPARVVA